METELVDRRKVVIAGGLLAAGGIVAGSYVSRMLSAPGRSRAPLPARPRLGDSHVQFIDRESSRAKDFAISFNKRTAGIPRLRALCKTPRSIAAMLAWAREHAITFAVRSGGHCFEDFSQSPELVIDTRLLNRVVFDRSERTVTVGAGALVSDVNNVVGSEGYAIPAGVCQSVGIAGLALGGGLGYLARAAGTTCDVLEAVDLVDAEARLLKAHAQSHADLFWACRGGGGGSFGVAAEFRFKAIAVPSVIVFEADWVLAPIAAAQFMTAWQSWAPRAPDGITTLLYIKKSAGGTVQIRLVGQSLGSERQLRSQMTGLTDQSQPRSAPRLRHHSFLEAANYLSTPDHARSRYHKSKSDIVTRPLPQEAFELLFHKLDASPDGALTIMFEALGGAMGRIPVAETAFPHRAGALFQILYSMDFRTRKIDSGHLQILSGLYEAMRPYMSGAAYVNYCDADLEDWPRAYWQSNLERLQAVKRKYDPENFFRHGQSVPLR